MDSDQGHQGDGPRDLAQDSGRYLYDKHGIRYPEPPRVPIDLAFYPAPEPNGTGVLVVPGGGYGRVSLDYEGLITREYLNSRGYDAWVLNYSTAETAPTPLLTVPLNEAVEAVRTIRAEGRVSKLGIWGYSAGGHLAGMTALKPGVDLDFAILGYPVITMDAMHMHEGSRNNLIGENPTQELQYNMSVECLVTDETPPIFMFHTANDQAVPVQNTLLLTQALAARGRPHQLLVLPDGPHGICLALEDPERNWTYELERWMKYSI